MKQLKIQNKMEEKNFVKSKAVSTIQSLVKQRPIKIKAQTKFPFDQKNVNIAFDNICYRWNKDEKNRKIIAMIIINLFPLLDGNIDEELATPAKDEFTGKPLIGLDAIRDFITKFNRVKEYSTELQQNQQDWQKSDKVYETLIQFVKDAPNYLKHADFSYTLETKTREIYISRESAYALKCFVKFGVLAGDKLLQNLTERCEYDWNHRNTIENNPALYNALIKLKNAEAAQEQFQQIVDL